MDSKKQIIYIHISYQMNLNIAMRNINNNYNINNR